MNHPPICPEPWCGMKAYDNSGLYLLTSGADMIDDKVLIAAHQACAWESMVEKILKADLCIDEARTNADMWRGWAEEQSK